MTFDGKAFGAEIVGVVKGYLEKELAPFSARIDDLQKRIDALPAPVDLSDELAALKSAVEAIHIPELPPLPDISAMVEEAVNSAVAALPVPESGKSVTVDDVAPLINAEVEKRVSELPKAKDGKDGIDGKDGLDVSDLFRAEGGKLIAVMSDGRTKDLGVFVGKDGEPGKPGEHGVGFDDLDVAYDGEKTVTIKFTRGDVVKEFPLVMPIVIDRGVYRDGNDYKSGDAVTWAGSVWIAQKDTSAKPDMSDDWRLSVKRGRDGKDGVVKEAKPHQPVRVGTPSGKE